MSAPNPEKGSRYLAQLNEALCNGDWAEVPELARKTEKHAPRRKCFALAARTEARIATTAPGSTGSASNLRDDVPLLNDAITAEKEHAEDMYMARVCLSLVHRIRDENELSTSVLPEKVIALERRGSDSNAIGWLDVCTARAAFLRADAAETSGNEDLARDLYLAAAEGTPGSRTVELRRWTERLLARACVFMYGRTSPPTPHNLTDALRCFTAWSSFWDRSPSPTSNKLASSLDVPRRQVWKAYYELLSTVLRLNLILEPTASPTSLQVKLDSEGMTDEQIKTCKLRQYEIIKDVEARYESTLLGEVKFPSASETNLEMEAWVDLAINNWKLIAGSSWADADLGDGGKERAGRSVLDILYRASTKTFHSTIILRDLFLVHSALGDFDLAMDAFNSYVELVDKALARAAKTGKHELGADSKNDAIWTAAAAIRVLNRYGDHEQAERAVEISTKLQKWVARGDQVRPEEQKEIPIIGPSQSAQEAVNPRSLAVAYRAVGIAKAGWARYTYESDVRDSLQAEAIGNLRSAEKLDAASIETAWALALVYAETQDVKSAVQVIKRVMELSVTSEQVADELDFEHFVRERKLVPLWHLLALCLTAKLDYDQAAKICDAAFDQFGEHSVLFGNTLESQDAAADSHPRSQGGLAKSMESVEKEGLLQVKMSQLELVELVDGADAAIEMSHELFSMYAVLFGQPENTKPLPKPPKVQASPQTHKSGTLRSLAGSIRPKSVNSSLGQDTLRHASVGSTIQGGDGVRANGQTNTQGLGPPIAITVTNEDGHVADKQNHHKHLPFKIRSHAGDWREMTAFKSKSSDNFHDKQKAGSNIINTGPNTVPSNAGAPTQAKSVSPAKVDETGDVPASADRPLKAMDHNTAHDTWPPPVGHEDQPPIQDVRLPVPHLTSFSVIEPRFDSTQERQHCVGVLVNVWLFIARLYLRADMLDDAGGAVDEAFKLAERFEADVGAEHSQARRFFEKGWGGGKSADELWADVLCVRGELSSAKDLPFEAMSYFDRALSHHPDHPDSIVRVSNLLMDIFEKKLPAEAPPPAIQPLPPLPTSLQSRSIAPLSKHSNHTPPPAHIPTSRSHANDPTPAELNRLAARDRAYMLLANLTRLGSGWDNAEAWYALARAHELSEQIPKAKQALWWVIELEENKPMRSWREISPGGFTL